MRLAENPYHTIPLDTIHLGHFLPVTTKVPEPIDHMLAPKKFYGKRNPESSQLYGLRAVVSAHDQGDAKEELLLAPFRESIIVTEDGVILPKTINSFVSRVEYVGGRVKCLAGDLEPGRAYMLGPTVGTFGKNVRDGVDLSDLSSPFAISVYPKQVGIWDWITPENYPGKVLYNSVNIPIFPSPGK